MIDRYKIIVWAKAKEQTIEEQVKQAYVVLDKLYEHKIISKLFLPDQKKDKTKEFELTYEDVKKLILEKQDKKLSDLGAEVSLFSSMNEDESLSINFSVGISNSNFINSMIISLPLNFSAEQMCNCKYLFKELVKVYQAFYACITSNFNLKAYNNWYNYDKNIPNTIFWMNYWGEDIANKLKVLEKRKNEKISKLYGMEEYEKGYVIRLQELPIDVNSEADINFQKEMNRFFEL